MQQQLDGTRIATLVAEKFGRYMSVSPEMVYGVDIEIVEQHLTDNIVLHLSKDVYGEKLEPETVTRTCSVPATWWQHYRFVHRGAWWLRWHVKRWPIKFEQITLTATWDNWVMYPWASYRFPADERTWGRPVRQTRPPTVHLESAPAISAFLHNRVRDDG